MSLRRFGVLITCVASVLALAGCGSRTPLDDSPLESGPFGGGGTDASTDAQGDATGDVLYDVVNDINGCNPSTCAGCCDEQGNCRTGLEAKACGSLGYACVNCAALDQSCSSATHQCSSTPSCDSRTCPSGCCTSDGQCLSGTDNTSCGLGGQACTDCTQQGLSCDSSTHACVLSPGRCGPENCKGCCDMYDKCEEGLADISCGMGGLGCIDCTQFGSTCDLTIGQCTRPNVCGPETCAGCCNPSTGACEWGMDATLCGSQGHACSDCSGQDQQCLPLDSTPGGYCYTNPQGCGPDNCAGCCDSAGNCRPGIEQEACGLSGMQCTSCDNGELCEAFPWGQGGQCTASTDNCGPWNCTGCCDSAGQCRPGTTADACGELGGICSTCGDNEQCQTYPGGQGGYCSSSTNNCGPWNCAGCCDASGQCRPGGGDHNCGLHGASCVDCSQHNLQCNAQSGTCQGQGSDRCGPSNCDGCCTQNGHCTPGFSNMRCGHGGEACQNCMHQGMSCQAGSCSP